VAPFSNASPGSTGVLETPRRWLGLVGQKIPVLVSLAENFDIGSDEESINVCYCQVSRGAPRYFFFLAFVQDLAFRK